MLGRLEIVHDGQSITPTAAKDRAFLGELLAHLGQPVSTEHLADVLWQDRLPAHPTNAVQVRASRLRATLRSIASEDVVEQTLLTRSGRYELSLDHAGTDVLRFEEAVSRDDMSGLLQGLALWRGAPFSDVPVTPCVEIQVARLEELRLSAMESYADLCLAEGSLPVTLVADLADEAARCPLRESLQYRLIRALHLTGRSADALMVYERLRRTLADELGTDPQPELRRLHLEIIAVQDPPEVNPEGEHRDDPAGPEQIVPERTRPPGRRVPLIVMAGLACLLGLGGCWFLQDPAPPDALAQKPTPVSQRPIPGDSSRLDADVTYPDGSSVKVGRRFVKTWKITNTGSVPWHDRRLMRQPLQSGTDGCDSQTVVPLPETEPGQQVLVSVSVEARSSPGRCKVYWKMVDAHGVLFMPHLSGIFFDVNVVS